MTDFSKVIENLKQRGYEQTSLAVQKANYAVGMYKKVGFEIVDENEEEYIGLSFSMKILLVSEL